MTDQEIRDIAFKNGFMAKWTRPGFGPDIHDYVFAFARAVRDAALEEAAKVCEETEVPFDIAVWLESTKQEMTAKTALALAESIRSTKTNA